MLEHKEHNQPKKESTHLDLQVNGKLHRKTGTTTVLTGRLQFNDECPCSTRVYTIETSSDANAPKRRIEVHVKLITSSFGHTSIRATVRALFTSQNRTVEI